MDDVNKVYALFSDPLWADSAQDPESFPNKRPLLAHYTAMSTFESIMRSEELWLANPLFMNDMEELSFGLLEADRLFRQHAGIQEACGGSGERYNALLSEFERQLDKIITGDTLDTYILCFCEHNMVDRDGLLSMWRGYGANGGGAALVFDTKQMPHVKGSPFILAKVRYGTHYERREWISAKLNQFASLLRLHPIPVEQFYLPVHSLLERFRSFALLSKHSGFTEEQEWRMVYIKDRDRAGTLSKMFDYHIRDERIEPKLKFKLSEIPEAMGGPLRLQDIIERIILGPVASSRITVATVQRMLTILGKEELARKVMGSTTPYRAKL